MTIPGFGRLTSSQGLRLGLIGYSLSRKQVTLDIPDEERLAKLRRAWEKLVRLTGQDFGYDLQLWHRFLADRDENDYTHPFAYAQVKQAVAAAHEDPLRIGLIGELEQLAIPDPDSARMHKKAQRLIKKYARPNPPRVGPPVASDEGIQEVWRWAVTWEHLGVLAALARPICALTPAQGRSRLRARLEMYARQCQEEGRERERAGFLIAIATLETDREECIQLYRQARRLYAREGDWGGEAFCAHHLAEIHRYRQEFGAYERLLRRAFDIWAAHDHRNGLGISLLHLSEVLDRAGKHCEACQLLYRAKMLLRHHITHITARDLLKRLSGDRGVPPAVYETDKTAQELVAEFFKGGDIGGQGSPG